MHRSHAGRILTLCILAAGTLFAQSAPADPVGTLLERLGDGDYRRREDATQALIALGPPVEQRLQALLTESTDPEVRHRLRYVLSNLHPPATGVLVISAAAGSGLVPGDVVTHVNTRPVAADGELVHLLGNAQFGATLRVRRETGTFEIGPVQRDQVQGIQSYAAPRGEGVARAVRLLHRGLAEQSFAELQQLEQAAPIAPGELAEPVRAVIAWLAGDGDTAMRWIEGQEEWAGPLDERDKWSSPSRLDWLVGMKAPYQLEWDLFTRAGGSLQSSSDDLDLRMQRVLIPGGAFVDALTRASSLWWQEYREARGQEYHISGNMLAVTGWMLYELGLRSECCRLIEPRSVILRNSRFGPQKWVRVDTDAWLPFFRGDDQAALDLFYEHAVSVIENPPPPPQDVIRNPQIAARLALFLYQFPDDKRAEQLLDVLAIEGHPAAAEYVRWMLMAVEPRNHRQIGRDLQVLLPKLDGPAALNAARAVALLEYTAPNPQRDVFQVAQQRLFESRDIEDRDLWVAIVAALGQLRGGQPDAALKSLAPFESRPETAILRSTAAFRAAPPAAARQQAALAEPLLVAPPDRSGCRLVMLADRRLAVFDEPAGTLTPVAPVTEAWFPNPLTWPWFGHDSRSGRSWVYARRRVVEITSDAGRGMSLNIATEDIPAFDRAAGVFAALAEAVASAPPLPATESGEFLASEVRAHQELTIDPSLRELGLMKPLPEDTRIVHLALRGGPHLLIDPQRDKVWSDTWIANRLGLSEPLHFLARAIAPSGEPGAAQRPPQLWLFSSAGLIRFDTADESLTRVALPGPQPHAAVIPEHAPYERRDPRFVYCARLPHEGGVVYRVSLADLAVQELTIRNLSQPVDYYRLLTRGQIRSQINHRFEELQMHSLEHFLAEVIAVTTRPGPAPTE